MENTIHMLRKSSGIVACIALSTILLFATPSQAQIEAIAGRVKARGASHNGDAVVYIDAIPGKTFDPTAEPVVLDQVKLTFIPHVLPVLVGTTIAFPNSDEVRHNVFSTSAPKRFNLGNYPPGVTKNITFNKSGVVTLLCNVHTEMSAYVIVIETPYFAVTDRDGNYIIRNVPPGDYTVKVWHEQLGTQVKHVRVNAGSATRSDFDLR